MTPTPRDRRTRTRTIELPIIVMLEVKKRKKALDEARRKDPLVFEQNKAKFIDGRNFQKGLFAFSHIKYERLFLDLIFPHKYFYDFLLVVENFTNICYNVISSINLNLHFHKVKCIDTKNTV